MGCKVKMNVDALGKVHKSLELFHKRDMDNQLQDVSDKLLVR